MDDHQIRGAIRPALNYARKAQEILPSDAKIKNFYEELKAISDRCTPREEESKQSEPELKGLKKVNVSNPEEQRTAQVEETKQQQPT